MNLQTETLAKQAAEYAIEFATQDQALYIPKLMEKFAELIVEQCADIIESQDVDPSFKLRLSWAVKQYFGVEQ